MRLSGLTVAWRGTPSLDDWVAYIVNGTKSKKLILADHSSERKVKSILARIQGMSKKEVEKLASELRAIDHWDTAYWRNRRPERYETLAFVARQKRRSEIMCDLLRATGHGSIHAVAESKQPTRSPSRSEEQKRKAEYA